MEKIYGMHKLVGLQLFWSRISNFSSGTPTFCQMGVLNSCFQNSSESSDTPFTHFGDKQYSCRTLTLSCLTDWILFGNTVDPEQLAFVEAV